ncbi:MAG TPA: hydrogen gas-evolving membrane-bound hydrogenase subunit E [Candidatus Binatia bacterium]|nr:hydrogen gas-evolving membrane-bound hydrogenase subunit E [Candidatus Binatia bacterium]
MNWLTGTVLALFFALLVYAESDLPDSRDPSAPTRTHVVPQYIEQSYPQTRTPNIVTSVLADYRGYDTLGETVVILTAGIAVILILPRNAGRG